MRIEKKDREGKFTELSPGDERRLKQYAPLKKDSEKPLSDYWVG